MSDTRKPKKLLFGELVSSRPFHGAKQRWRDVTTTDLRTLSVPLDSYYKLTSERNGWCRLYNEKISAFMVCQQPRLQHGDYGCRCGQWFHCQGDLTHYSRFCDGQPRSIQTHFEYQCGRVLHRKGDLTCHSRFCLCPGWLSHSRTSYHLRMG